MINRITLLLFIGLVFALQSCKPIYSYNPYLDQKPPGITPELFAPSLVNTDAIEINTVFNSSLTELFFTRIIDGKFINYNFFENENEINLFFDRKTFNLIGWQTVDIYQNLSITYLSTIIKNQKLNKNLFVLPERN